MTDTENTTAHEEPKSKTSSIPTVSESLLFKNGWQEFGFVLAVMLGQSFNLTPFGATLNARWLIADDLGVPGDNGQMSWIAAGFSITTGSFVLVGGRLGDVYGHRIVWLLALAWSMIWNLVSGFARSPAFYDAARGLTGIGAGLMLPTAVALLGQTYPPGRKRNLAFGLFGLQPVPVVDGSTDGNGRGGTRPFGTWSLPLPGRVRDGSTPLTGTRTRPVRRVQRVILGIFRRS